MTTITLSRQHVQYSYYGAGFHCFGIPEHVADPEFAYFTDCLYGDGQSFAWAEAMKIRKSSIVAQPDLFAPAEADVVAIAWYGDANDED